MTPPLGDAYFAAPRVTCPVCGGDDIPLFRNGRMYPHRERHVGKGGIYVSKVRCTGSLRRPRDLLHDDRQFDTIDSVGELE